MRCLANASPKYTFSGCNWTRNSFNQREKSPKVSQTQITMRPERSSLYIFREGDFTRKTVMTLFADNLKGFKVNSGHFSRMSNWKWDISKIICKNHNLSYCCTYDWGITVWKIPTEDITFFNQSTTNSLPFQWRKNSWKKYGRMKLKIVINVVVSHVDWIRAKCASFERISEQVRPNQ